MSFSLRDKTLNGMGWSLIENVVGTGTTFLVGIVLARLLSPTEFGIIGLINVFLAIALIFVDSGFSQALIRKKEVSRADYSTLFFFNLLVAIICYIIIFFTSEYIALFFDQPILGVVLKVMAVTLIFNAVAIVQRVILSRKIDFRTQAFVTIISSFVSGAVGIIMALNDCGVWSLVGQIVSRYFMQSVSLWIWCRWKLELKICRKSLSEMFNFGYKLLLSGLIDTLYKNVFYIVIGKCYSAKTLGQYTRAAQFTNIFSANLLAVIQKVSYPVLSSIQDDADRLKKGYRIMIKNSMLITFALMLGMAAVAKPMILILIGEQWLPAVHYLQILCFSEMLYPLHAINLNILNVKGRSDLFLKLEVIKKIMAIPMIFVGIYWSIDAMLWYGVAFSFATYFLNAFYSANLIDYSILEQIKDVYPTFIVSMIVASVMWSVTLLEWNIYLTLGIQIVVGLLLAIGIYEKLNLEEYNDIKNIILSRLKRIKV